MPKLKLITLEVLLEMMENKENFKLIETLSLESFSLGHIQGAVNLPTPRDTTPEQISVKAEKLGINKTDIVITYCASYTCVASTRAARLLLEAGFTNVLDFKASKKGWVDARFELKK